MTLMRGLATDDWLGGEFFCVIYYHFVDGLLVAIPGRGICIRVDVLVVVSLNPVRKQWTVDSQKHGSNQLKS